MILPIIFYHGEGTFTAPVKMRELVRVVKGLERYVLDLEAILFVVSALKSDEFPEDTELSVLFMTLQLVFSTDVAERLIEIYRKLQPTLHLPESQKELRDAIYYAATSAKHFSRQDFQKVSTQIEKEGVLTVSTSLLDQLLAEGEAKGIAKGEAKGKAEGKAEFGRKAVLNVLCKRFKMTDVPSEIKAAIQRMNDSIALESLLSYALDCQTLDEFAEALN
jgi:hypothetical protein